MYIQEITLEIKTKASKNKLIDEFNLLMSFYCGNGQTQGRIESQYISNDKISCFPFTIENDSLDQNHNNTYVNEQIKKLEKLANAQLTFRTAGKSYATYIAPCKCKNPRFYILITNYTTIESPLT